MELWNCQILQTHFNRSDHTIHWFLTWSRISEDFSSYYSNDILYTLCTFLNCCINEKKRSLLQQFDSNLNAQKRDKYSLWYFWLKNSIKCNQLQIAVHILGQQDASSQWIVIVECPVLETVVMPALNTTRICSPTSQIQCMDLTGSDIRWKRICRTSGTQSCLTEFIKVYSKGKIFGREFWGSMG